MMAMRGVGFRRHSKLLVILGSACLVAACGRSEADSGAGGGSGVGNGSGGDGATSGGGSGEGGKAVTVGSGGGGTGGSINTDTYEVSIGPFNTAPGDEQTMCVVIDVGNEKAGMLRGIRTNLTAGSHHLIVTKVDEGGPQTTPTPCSAFAHPGDSLFIAEKPTMELTYPNGSGLPFSAHQLVGLEMHYINSGTAGPIDIAGSVEFDITDQIEDLNEVKLLFAGPFAISIPPQSTAEVSDTIGIEAGAQVFALTSHTHRLGVHATIERWSNGSATELLHESTSWAEPPFDIFQPALTLAPNEQFRLTCQYNNPTTQTVTFGTSFYDEMCFLWAHYIVE